MLFVICVLLSAAIHVAFFVLESLLFARPQVARIFDLRPDEVPSVRLFALNQGFYNLFLAAFAVAGLWLVHSGAEPFGSGLVLGSCGTMVGAGVVLVASAPKAWLGALFQAVPPAIALAAFFLR